MLSAAVNSGGGIARGSGVANSAHQGGSGLYQVIFNRNVSSCVAVATLSEVPGGGTTAADNGEITTAIHESSVFVRTRNSSGAPTDLPFHLIVSC